MHVLIRQAKIIDTTSEYNGKTADLLIEKGIIKKIATHIDAKVKTEISGKDLYVSSGWVDVLADYREPGYEHKETIVTGMQAAANGGFTDVMLVPNTLPVVSNKGAVQYILQKAAGNAVSIHPMGSATQGSEGKALAEMMDMHTHGAVAFTDGWKPVQDSNVMLKALEYVKTFDGVLVQIPVDDALSKGGLMHEGSVSTLLGMAGIPAIAETLMVHRDIELLHYTGSRLHISGISSAASVAMIKAAKKEGLNITCSVTPYHLALNDEILKTYDSLYKVSPPIRTEEDRQALISGLKDGTIDCIASHHRPHEWDAKAKEFEYASDGMNVQENAFQLAWEAVSKKVPIERLIEAITEAPRKIFGLQAVNINEGNNAQLTIFTTGGRYKVEEGASLGKNNPFVGTELQGKVLGIINNEQVHLNK
jgi:dihydroorotase